jgi:CRISPR-associated protein Cas8a1/Csx13
VLIILEVDDLESFVFERPVLTPFTPQECRVGGSGDAVLQAMTRLRLRSVATTLTLPGCSTTRFAPAAWSTQQKSRVNAFPTDFRDATRFATETESVTDRNLNRFELMLAVLPPRIHNPQARRASSDRPDDAKPTKRKTRKASDEGKAESYWIESVVRPFIADNLAQGRPSWYADFARLVQSVDAAKKVSYEHKGLQLMATNTQFTTDQERRFILTMHRAMARVRSKIYREILGDDAAKKHLKPNQAVFNRWNRFGERLRLSLVGAKTVNQVQAAISELLSRRGYVKELRDNDTFAAVHDFLFHEQWERVRSLALFALASYKRPVDEDVVEGDDQENNQ